MVLDEVSYLIHCDTLLQNATAILLQNATKIYYKMRQKFITKCLRFFITKCVSFIMKCDSNTKGDNFIIKYGSYYKLPQYNGSPTLNTP